MSEKIRRAKREKRIVKTGTLTLQGNGPVSEPMNSERDHGSMADNISESHGRKTPGGLFTNIRPSESFTESLPCGRNEERFLPNQRAFTGLRRTR